MGNSAGRCIGGDKMAQNVSCDTCKNFVFDEKYDGYICLVNMDEDDVYRLHSYRECPYYQSDDDYLIVRKQK